MLKGFGAMFWTFALAFIIAVVVPLPSVSAGRLTQTDYLKGVDTVIVDESVVPEHILLPQHVPTPEEIKNPSPPLILRLVRDIFSQQPWISVKQARDVPLKEQYKSNVICLNYAVSAQQETINGQPVKVGSLALQILKYHPDGTRTAIAALPPATYPFLVPDSESGFNKKIAEGVHYMTDYLPSHFVCANKYGYPSAACPDCSLDNCKPKYPFEERLRAPCPVPEKGQNIPVPCGIIPE